MPRTSPAHAHVWQPPPVRRGTAPALIAALISCGLLAFGLDDPIRGARAVAAPVAAQAINPARPAPAAPGSAARPRSAPPAPSVVPVVVTHPGPNEPPTTTPGAISGLAADGIPAAALRAYQNAVRLSRRTDPACGLPWALLAAIGRIESDHGRFADSVLYDDGLSVPPVIGIPLNGVGTEVITDTDRGQLDGDRVYDRAVGPMQFIPSTWTIYRADGNRDGRMDPFNIFDAAAAAGHYLCTAGGNLGTTAGQVAAVLAYNHSDSYLASVLALEASYAGGAAGSAVPVLSTAPRPIVGPELPAVDAGRPLALPKPPKPAVHSTHPTATPTRSPTTSCASASPSVTATSSTTPSASGTASGPPSTGLDATASDSVAPSGAAAATDSQSASPSLTATGTSSGTGMPSTTAAPSAGC